MSSTTSTDLHAFQVAVRDRARSIKSEVYGSDRYVDQFLADLGLDNLVEDVQVIVTVTVPASDPDAAISAVQDQLATVYLPSGWSAAATAVSA